MITALAIYTDVVFFVLGIAALAVGQAIFKLRKPKTIEN